MPDERRHCFAVEKMATDFPGKPIAIGPPGNADKTKILGVIFK